MEQLSKREVEALRKLIKVEPPTYSEIMSYLYELMCAGVPEIKEIASKIIDLLEKEFGKSTKNE